MKASLGFSFLFAFALSLVLTDGSAEASLPSVLDGRFPADSSQFPGQGTCVADGTSGVGMNPFPWLAPPCQIDPNVQFEGNPQFVHVVQNVSSNPVFGGSSVPEPGTLLLLGGGMAGLARLGRRPLRG